jgi:8-oxo-dGTP pyrophosphatase MutT (NUDIX family)
MSPKWVYKGKLLCIAAKKVKLPNGHTASFEVIHHPGATLIVAFLASDTVILLKQFRAALNTYLYELPAGTLASGESPLAAAKREIIEETGYAAGSCRRIGHIYPVPGYSTEKITIYKATRLRKSTAAHEHDEVISVLKVTRPQVRRLFKSGRIQDAKTICALAMCGWL